MTDTSNPYAAGFFFANEPGVNLKMREKIALAQMMQKSKAPQNLGEGIFSIGDSISDAIIARQLQQQDRDAQLVASKLGAPKDPASVTPVSYAPQEDVPRETELKPPIAATQVNLQPTIRPPSNIDPATGMPPPTGAPGDTGATTFTPPGGVAPPGATETWRKANPLPPGIIPQGPPTPLPAPTAPAPPPVFPAGRFDAAFPNRQQALPFAGTPSADVPPPAGPRDAVAATLNARQAPSAAPAALAATSPPDQGIRPAPLTQMAQAGQPAPVAGYVTPIPSPTPGAEIVGPGKREMELRAVLAANQGNPYAAQSPAANELKRLEENRGIRQAEANERFKSGLKTEGELKVLRETQRGDQTKRMVDVEETRQKLINYGQTVVPEGGGAPGRPDPRLGTPDSPQRTGRPVIDPVPAGAIPVEWAKEQQKKVITDAASLEAARPELSEALDLMTKIKAHPGKARSIGLLGGLGQLTPEGQGFSALDEQLKGKNLVAAYQKIKGTGPVGEREGENIAKAQAALTKAGTEKDYNAALDTLETTMRGAVERIERKLNRPVTAYQNTPDDPYAPDLNQRGLRTMPTSNGKKVEVEYVGGDPDKDSSYKTVRR